jgi:choline dehydrogenase
MPTTSTTWLSTLSSQIPSALSSLSTSQSLDATVLKGITAQFATQLDMLQNGEGQLEIIMTMLSGAGSAGIQLALQHAWSRGEVAIGSASAFDYPTINPVSFFFFD